MFVDRHFMDGNRRRGICAGRSLVPGILRDGAYDEQRVFRLDAIFLDLQLVFAGDGVAEKEVAHVVRHGIGRRENRVAVFTAKVAVQIEFCATRINQEFAGVVVEKERDVKDFLGNFFPVMIAIRLVALPGYCSVIEAGQSGDRSMQSERPGRETADLDKPERGTSNFRLRRGLEQAAASQQLKAANEQIQPRRDRQQVPNELRKIRD